MASANVYIRSVCAAIRVGRVLLMIGGLWWSALPSPAQTPDMSASDQPRNSWTAATELKSDDLLPTRIPVRIVESHSQNGNQTIDKRSVQIQGVDGRLATYQEIETVSLQVDSSTVRTTVRTFGRDVNGARSLIQVTEEERHTLPGGGSNVLRTIFNPDVNGRLEPVQRETIEMKSVSKDVEETNTTVMLPDINGGLAPGLKTRKLRKRRADGTTEAQETTLIADGAGNWELSEVRQVTTVERGANRSAEERVLRRDAEGKLIEVSRVVSNESTSDSAERRVTVETYSIDVPGSTRDGSLHLVERATTSSQANATGEQISEQTVEQTNPGDPRAGLRLSILVNSKMVPGPSGEQGSVTIRVRDSNDTFATVAVDTTTSDRIPTIQIEQTPSEQPK